VSWKKNYFILSKKKKKLEVDACETAT